MPSYFLRQLFGSHARLVVLLIAVAGMNLILLVRLPLEDADEATYAMVVREMRESGNYLTLSLDGSPWVDKPPLYFWLTAASTRPLTLDWKATEQEL